MTNLFTGRHITLILIAFFGVVIAVNIALASLASSTFGGTLAENGYVASQEYDRWIQDAAAQERLGWSIATTVDQGRLVLVTTGVQGALVAVTALHPLGLKDDHVLQMRAESPNRYRSANALPPGRWQLQVELRAAGHRARFRGEVRR